MRNEECVFRLVVAGGGDFFFRESVSSSSLSSNSYWLTFPKDNVFGQNPCYEILTELPAGPGDDHRFGLPDKNKAFKTDLRSANRPYPSQKSYFTTILLISAHQPDRLGAVMIHQQVTAI